ncbi:MAG: hypothetical protein ACE5KC_00950 [Candidatus Bathyarchaeia archaeon]
MAIAPDGGIWLAVDSKFSQIIRFDPVAEDVASYPAPFPPISDSVTGGLWATISLDPSGNVWSALADEGNLTKFVPYDTTTVSANKAAESKEAMTSELSVSRKSFSWSAKEDLTATTFFASSISDGNFIKYPIPADENGERPVVMDTLVDSEGNIWVGAVHGDLTNMSTLSLSLFKLNVVGSTWTKYSVPSVFIYWYGDMEWGPDGLLWFNAFKFVSTDDIRGLIVSFDPVTAIWTEYELETQLLPWFGLAIDNLGRVWFLELPLPLFGKAPTAEVAKIGMFDPASSMLFEYPLGEEQLIPVGIDTDSDGNIWFAEIPFFGYEPPTIESRMAMFNPTTHKLFEYPTVTPNTIIVLPVIDHIGNVWFLGSIQEYGKPPTKSLIVKLVPPEVSDVTPPVTNDDYDGLWHTADFQITLTATDPSGVAETYYKINDGPTRSVSADGQPYITVESANNKLEYWSVDNVGIEEIPHKILTGIKLDKTPPTGSIVINNDATLTTLTSVTLSLTAEDATSGVGHVRFSNDGVWDTEPWEAFSAIKEWTLTYGDGTKTVYYQIKDNAGLTSSTYSDTIILQLDTDGDGTLDVEDPDDDNDGVPDVDDAFPLDASESLDTDGDGVGNNADTDDDNDGMPDTWETENDLDPLNAADASLDPDGDGLTNLEEYQGGTDPNASDAEPPPPEEFPLWAIGTVVAAILIGIAAVAMFLWKRRG